MGSFGRGSKDSDTGQTYYRRGDGSEVAEKTQVDLTVSERRTVELEGEVEVRRGSQTITLTNDTGDSDDTTVDVVYED